MQLPMTDAIRVLVPLVAVFAWLAVGGAVGEWADRRWDVDGWLQQVARRWGLSHPYCHRCQTHSSGATCPECGCLTRSRVQQQRRG